MKIRRESQSASDLSQASKEDFGARHLRVWRQVLRITCIANNGLGRDAAQQKRRRRQTRRADHDIGLGGESLAIVFQKIVLLEIGRDLHLNSIGLQLRGEPA